MLTYGIGSSSLLGSLSYEGVVTSPVVSSTVPILPIRPVLPTPILPFLMSATSGASSAYSKLRTDLQALEQRNCKGWRRKSGVTIETFRTSQMTHRRSRRQDSTSTRRRLNPVISELAVAVAGGAVDQPAQTRLRRAVQ